MLSKAVYTPYDMEYTILMDFSLDDLAGVMDVKQKYSGKGSYFDAVDTYQDAYESVFTTMDRDFCPADSNWIQYAKPNDCSLSWVTMIVNAGERALAMVGGNDRAVCRVREAVLHPRRSLPMACRMSHLVSNEGHRLGERE